MPLAQLEVPATDDLVLAVVDYGGDGPPLLLVHGYGHHARLWDPWVPELAERYRVLQMLGDDLNDFVAVPPQATIDYRRRLSDRYRERWGDSWFQLPNPLYGSWEQAITPDGTSIFDSPLGDTIRMLDTD